MVVPAVNARKIRCKPLILITILHGNNNSAGAREPKSMFCRRRHYGKLDAGARRHLLGDGGPARMHKHPPANDGGHRQAIRPAAAPVAYNCVIIASYFSDIPSAAMTSL
jgi:hypothetical protein